MAMDVENGIRRIHGLDLSKRTFKCCVLTADRNFEDRTVIPGSMDPEGRMKFASTLCETDLVVMEGGTSSYNFARELIEHTDAEVVVLNPSKLHIIFQSQCKTDKQDCVKLARYVRDTNRDNWATLKVPTKEETELRSVINQYDGAVKDRTKAINRLHAVFNQNGFPLLKKADLASNEGRLANITELLDGYAYEVAIVLEREISNCEVNIGNYMAMIREIVQKRPKELLIWMSIPGIGLMTAASLIAYVGDGERFSKPAELRNYIGLVPRIDQSGDRNIVGKVSAYGCKPVRKNIIQGALSVKNGLLLQAAGQGQDETADRSWGRKQDVDDWPHASQERTAVQGLWQLQHAEEEAEGSRTGRRRHEHVSRADADGILNQVTRVQDSLMPAF